jgi:PAS domain S-box-containing protein
MKSTEPYLFSLEESSTPMWVVETQAWEYIEPKSVEVIDVNNAALRFFGCSREEFQRVKLREIFSPELEANLLDCLRRKKPQGKEGIGSGEIWRFRRKDGKWLSGEISLNPARMQDRKIFMVIWNEQNRARLRGMLDVTDDGMIGVGKE